MREQLTKGIAKLSWLYPQLTPNITFSEHLTQEELGAFVTFAHGHAQAAIEENKTINIHHAGVPAIKQEDVERVEVMLAAATKNENMAVGDVIDHLREQKEHWQTLHAAYSKITQHELVGTTPIVADDFHAHFHQCIHSALENAGIKFEGLLNEGLVVYLHEQTYGSEATAHYSGETGKQYLEHAKQWKELMKDYPKSAIVPLLKKIAI